MEENTDLSTKGDLNDRVRHIMDLVGLEIAGFAELTNISESHLYALINGTKSLTQETAAKIAAAIKLRAAQILNPDYIISAAIRNAPAVKKFHSSYKKGNPEYFTETKASRKNAYFIEHELIPRGVFSEPVYGWQVRNACAQLGIDLSSKQVSQHLNYLVETQKLKSEMRELKKKNGEMAERKVHVYYTDKKQ